MEVRYNKSIQTSLKEVERVSLRATTFSIILNWDVSRIAQSDALCTRGQGRLQMLQEFWAISFGFRFKRVSGYYMSRRFRMGRS
jgi:hypothetical protein